MRLKMLGRLQTCFGVCQTWGGNLDQDSQLFRRATSPAQFWALRGKFSSFSPPVEIDTISTKTKTFNEPDQLSSGEGTQLGGETLMFQTSFQ